MLMPAACSVLRLRGKTWPLGKLPALIAFQGFMDEQREALPSGDWTEKFDRPYRRITEQILPMFPASVVGGARVEAAESSARLLYLPPEAYGS